MFNLTDHIPKEKLEKFCHKNHIKKLAIFGSALKDELRPDSDIDILVVFDEKNMPGLFEISRMEIELSEMLKRKIDLRTPEDLSRYFREEVVQSARVHYEET